LYDAAAALPFDVVEATIPEMHARWRRAGNFEGAGAGSI